MIKINLLESVTERQNTAVVAVERKVASPLTRMIMMGIAVFFLLSAVIAFDIISTQRAKAQAESELENQKRIAAELEAVMKEQKDLEARIANIDMRINAIKRLRSTQAGPSAVLEALKERIIMSPGLYLEAVEQKGDQLTITGNSPDESVVTQFGRSLEFSNGLFSNLNIETQRKDNPLAQPVGTGAPAAAPKSEIVNFKINCAYTPSKAGNSSTAGGNGVINAAGVPNQQQQPAANAPNQQAAAAPAPPQVARN